MPFDATALTAAVPRAHADARVADFSAAPRVWAVGGLYGRLGALDALHEKLHALIQPDDALVYLGNYMGPHSLWTGEGAAIIDALMAFKVKLVQDRGLDTASVVFLKGPGEDLLQSAQRLAFQKEAQAWLDAALAHGLEAYAAAYGVDGAALRDAAAQDLFSLNRISHFLQQSIAAHAGHKAFYACLKQAAFHVRTAFVPAGLNPTHPLHLQSEALCWPDCDLGAGIRIAPWQRVVRGQSYTTHVPDRYASTLTLDDGRSMEGKLHAACLDARGTVVEMLSF